MTGSAFLAEQIAMRAAVAVAGEAVEGVHAVRPGLQIRQPMRWWLRAPRAADRGQGFVVHAGRSHLALMLDMARRK